MASTYTWALDSGTLPTGISLDTGATDLSSALTGTPTVAGTYKFTVSCTNDVSAAVDYYTYIMTVDDNVIQITPDLGLSNDMSFDPAQNPRLKSVFNADLTLATGESQTGKYSTLRHLVVVTDIGSGSNPYSFNLGSIDPGARGERWYLWRLSSDEDTIYRTYLV